MVLPLDFYRREDVLLIARELLGMVLVTHINGQRTAGIIVETEAYAGVNDRASHAFGGRRTARTEVMYQDGGVAYVYLCYGIHYLFNVVTHGNDIPQVVLIRAVEPTDGIEVMLQRRKMTRVEPRLTAGPGALCQALGIDKQHNGASLINDTIWIEDRGVRYDRTNIVAGTRVGVGYAHDDAWLPYRFSVKGNAFVSRGKGV